MEYFCHFSCIKQNFTSALEKTKKRAIDRVEMLSSVKLKRALLSQCASGFCACFFVIYVCLHGISNKEENVFSQSILWPPRASKSFKKHQKGRSKPLPTASAMQKPFLEQAVKAFLQAQAKAFRSFPSRGRDR